MFVISSVWTCVQYVRAFSVQWIIRSMRVQKDQGIQLLFSKKLNKFSNVEQKFFHLGWRNTLATDYSPNMNQPVYNISVVLSVSLLS